MITAGSIVIPGALTIARGLPDMTGGDLSAAIVGGYEAMVRLGLAIDGPTILYRGIWPTYLAAPFGIAAVAARLLRLGERETADALALALTLASPGVGHHNVPTTSRWLAAGNAARNGLTAALAAQSGFTADRRIFEGGFLTNIYGIAPRAAALADGFGIDWMLGQVSFKPWCAARQTMAATQALREILEAGVTPDDVTQVRAAVLPPHLRMIDHGVTAGDRASHLTSVQYQMAIAALAPDRALDVGQSPNAIPESLQSFMQRITVVGDDALLAGYPAAWPARVTVVTRSGTRERLVTHVPGDPARPFGAADIATKFTRLVAPVLGPQGSEDMLQRFVDAMGSRAPLPPGLIDEVTRICREA
jgi:2-methylcitrate dehydratase PrpD